ncbi:hypothetical protein L1987_69917 [Smallanthus sonchifolius]|uniref:Uncharacterized protein n=1 Tax=Smallanthus sonchifolius TaxID=185202 RepID=A0ACB9B6A2_9ASTR|nr:hypothetical protein L1987_69917 [Smallanthus sonchifolius]
MNMQIIINGDSHSFHAIRTLQNVLAHLQMLIGVHHSFFSVVLLHFHFLMKQHKAIVRFKCSKTTNKEEMVHVDEHLKVRENIVQTPNGMKAVSITVDDDLHVDEEQESMKNEKIGKNLHHDGIHAQTATSQV